MWRFKIKIENCGFRCNLYGGFRHFEDQCWKKEPKIKGPIVNYL